MVEPISPKQEAKEKAGALFDWLRKAGVDYAQLLKRAATLAVWVLLGCLVVVLGGLVTGLPAWIPGVAIALAGVTVTVVLLLFTPLLLPIELMAGLEVAAPVKAFLRRQLKVLFFLLVAALLVALIPSDSDPRLRVLFVLVAALIALGISAKAIDTTWEQVGSVAKWKLITIFFFLMFALSFPRTGAAVLGLRARADRVARQWLAGPRLTGEAGQRAVDCDSLPERIWSPDGDTLLWYSRTPDGEYEVFSRGGHHPTRAIALLPVSADSEAQGIKRYCTAIRQQRIDLRRAETLRIQATIDSQAAADARATAAAAAAGRTAAVRADSLRRERYLLARRLDERVEFIVVAASPDGRMQAVLAQAVVAELRTNGVAASDVVFSRAFVDGGGFESFFDGRGAEDIRVMPLASMANRLMMVRVKFDEPTQSTTVAGLLSVAVHASVRVLVLKDAQVSSTSELTAVGVGTSERGAVEAAVRRLASQIGQRRY